MLVCTLLLWCNNWIIFLVIQTRCWVFSYKLYFFLWNLVVIKASSKYIIHLDFTFTMNICSCCKDIVANFRGCRLYQCKSSLVWECSLLYIQFVLKSPDFALGFRIYYLHIRNFCYLCNCCFATEFWDCCRSRPTVIPPL